MHVVFILETNEIVNGNSQNKHGNWCLSERDVECVDISTVDVAVVAYFLRQGRTKETTTLLDWTTHTSYRSYHVVKSVKGNECKHHQSALK